MKVLVLSEGNSIHTQRWCESLAKSGVEVLLFTLRIARTDWFDGQKVSVFSAGLDVQGSARLWRKARYLCAVVKIWQAIKTFKPDIVHAHYASSYGLLGALAGFHPYVVSVWGADVYEFPRANWLARQVIRFVFRRADCLLSTSHVMAREAARYTDKHFAITPFGVDLQRFSRVPGVEYDPNLIGTVKTLRPKYGIDVLIRAFALCVERNPARPLRLYIAGTGWQRGDLEQLAQELGVGDRVEFAGFIDNAKLPELYSRFLVSAFPSVEDSESFGVVAVEAGACECPVVTSDADGFTETVVNGETGLIVPKRDVEGTAGAIQYFLDHPEERERMGRAGRRRAEELYDWRENVGRMVSIYENVLEGSGNRQEN